jgi:hypothetical protein
VEFFVKVKALNGESTLLELNKITNNESAISGVYIRSINYLACLSLLVKDRSKKQSVAHQIEIDVKLQEEKKERRYA